MKKIPEVHTFDRVPYWQEALAQSCTIRFLWCRMAISWSARRRRTRLLVLCSRFAASLSICARLPPPPAGLWIMSHSISRRAQSWDYAANRDAARPLSRSFLNLLTPSRYRVSGSILIHNREVRSLRGRKTRPNPWRRNRHRAPGFHAGAQSGTARLRPD